MYSHLAILEYLRSSSEAAMFADFRGCSRFQPSPVANFSIQGQVSFIRNHSAGSWRRAFNAASIEKFLCLCWKKSCLGQTVFFTCNQTNFAVQVWLTRHHANSSLFFFLFIFLFFNPSSHFHSLPLIPFHRVVFLIRTSFSFSSLFQLFTDCSYFFRL